MINLIRFLTRACKWPSKLSNANKVTFYGIWYTLRNPLSHKITTKDTIKGLESSKSWLKLNFDCIWEFRRPFEGSVWEQYLKLKLLWGWGYQLSTRRQSYIVFSIHINFHKLFSLGDGKQFSDLRSWLTTATNHSFKEVRIFQIVVESCITLLHNVVIY